MTTVSTPHTASPSRESPSLTSTGYLLHLAISRLSEGIVVAIAGSGLHVGQLAILGALTDAGAMSQRKLAEMTKIEKSSLVLFLDALEGEGWVQRRTNPQDRRSHNVHLTPKGAAKFRTLGPKLKTAQDSFLAPLTPDEQTHLTDMLQRLAAGTK